MNRILIAQLWDSRDVVYWQAALERYWEFVQPQHIALERAMEQLDRGRLQAFSPDEWFDFLHDEYFCWKYTAANRYATSTGVLRRKITGSKGRLVLDKIRQRLLTIDPVQIRAPLETACQIPGLGTAGASGLLALLYPEFFGTVDQFVVKALRDIPVFRSSGAIMKMIPEGLTVVDGEILIRIMRRQARALSEELNLPWTPRMVDKVLWTYGRD